jgi:hypothetical protein
MTDLKSKYLIEQEFYKLRLMQLGAELTDSELFAIICKVFNVTGGIKEGEMIHDLIRKLKARERINKQLEH